MQASFWHSPASTTLPASSVSLARPNDALLLPLLTLLVNPLPAPPYNSSARDVSLYIDDTFSLALLHLLSRRFLCAAVVVGSLPQGNCLSTGFVASQAMPLPFSQQSLLRRLPGTRSRDRNLSSSWPPL